MHADILFDKFNMQLTYIYILLLHSYIVLRKHGVVLQLDSLSTEAAVTITFVITFILTLIIATVIAFIITYICVKRKFEKILQGIKNKQQNKAVSTISKNNLELQPNPAYDTSHKVTMDTNPAYESYK